MSYVNGTFYLSQLRHGSRDLDKKYLAEMGVDIIRNRILLFLIIIRDDLIKVKQVRVGFHP